MEAIARDTSQVTYHVVPVVIQRLRFSHGPWTPRSFFYSSVLKGVSVTNVGDSVQVDTKLGGSEPGPTYISIEI